MKAKKLLSFVLAAIMMLSALSINAFASNTDSPYASGVLPSVNAGKVSSYNPYVREKENNTATYIYNQNGDTMNFGVHGTLADGSYDEWDCTRKKGQIAVGQQRFFSQWVYEYGYRYCKLVCWSIKANTASSGVWSPDSVGSYPYCNL